jgi:hypothetical protein
MLRCKFVATTATTDTATTSRRVNAHHRVTLQRDRQRDRQVKRIDNIKPNSGQQSASLSILRPGDLILCEKQKQECSWWNLLLLLVRDSLNMWPLWQSCYKTLNLQCCSVNPNIWYDKGKAVPLQAWSGPDGSMKLRFPDFMTTAQDGGKVVSLTHRPPLPPGNTPGTCFC